MKFYMRLSMNGALNQVYREASYHCNLLGLFILVSLVQVYST